MNFADDRYSCADVPDVIREECVMDDHVNNAEDEYGGMDDITYDGIYMFLRMQVYPEFIQNNEDRNARSHWKLKCQKYGIVYNHLVFINKEGSKDVKVKRRFVVRVGEVYSILASVHEKIGHLGMKRTQAAVLHCFYWRSVRADVQRFVNSCEFCNKKKFFGKKVLKTLFDVFGITLNSLEKPFKTKVILAPDVIQVCVRPDVQNKIDRFIISLKDESLSGLSNRLLLSAYTFKPKNHIGVPQHCQSHRSGSIVPLGHSLDGFHELHAMTANSVEEAMVSSRWTPEFRPGRRPSNVHGQKPDEDQDRKLMDHSFHLPSTSTLSSSSITVNVVNDSTFKTDDELISVPSLRKQPDKPTNDIIVVDYTLRSSERRREVVHLNDCDRGGLAKRTLSNRFLTKRTEEMGPNVCFESLDEYCHLPPIHQNF